MANLALNILGFLVLVFWSAPLFSAAMVQFAPSFFLKLQVTCYSLQLQQAPNHPLSVLVQCQMHEGETGWVPERATGHGVTKGRCPPFPGRQVTDEWEK